MGRSQPGCRQDTEGEVVRGGAHRRRWFGWSLKGGEDSGSGQRAGDQSEQRREAATLGPQPTQGLLRELLLPGVAP